MKSTVKIISYLLIASVFIISSSCTPGEQTENKELLIPYPNWAEGIAFTNLAKVVLEERGYDPTIKPIEPGPIYASLSKGDADVFLDAWLPHTHQEYWERYGDQLVKLGESFSNGTTGLVVPTYVEIDSISQLNEYQDRFDSEIIGIGSGAGIHGNTLRAIEAYNLDFKQVTSSGPAMMASLQKAVANDNWIVITGWKPHFMWDDYDLKYLADPKDIYPKDVCAIVARQGFEEDFPELAEFFNNFNLTEEQLYSLMNEIEQGDDTEEAARTWYQNNKELVDGWFPETETVATN